MKLAKSLPQIFQSTPCQYVVGAPWETMSKFSRNFGSMKSKFEKISYEMALHETHRRTKIFVLTLIVSE